MIFLLLAQIVVFYLNIKGKELRPHHFTEIVNGSFTIINYDQCDPDWAIFCFLGKHSKPVGAIILPKWLTLLGDFCKGVKIILFSSEIIFRQLLQTFGDFLLVTLERMKEEDGTV